MKIVCEACQAKYSISDDKVRGKAFKIRCKKCSNIIVVRSTGAMDIPAAMSGTLEAQPAPVAVAVAAESAWHIVVDGEQVGPLTGSDIRARLARGEIYGETYIWREGMADWLKLSSVPELADAVAEAPAQAARPAARHQPAASAQAAARADEDMDVFAAPTVVSAKANDLFASPVSASSTASSSGGGFAFGGSAAAASEPVASYRGGNGASAAVAAPVSGLTAQRHENSVLFSLSNLEKLASPAQAASPAPRPGVSGPIGEGSGLIDIRSMAASTLGNTFRGPSATADLPTFGAPAFSPVAPVLMPLPAASAPKWQFIVLGVLVVTVLGLGFAMYKVFTGRPPMAVAPGATTPAPAGPGAPVPTPAPAAEPSAAAQPVIPTTQPPPATEELPPRDKPAVVVERSRPRDRGRDRRPGKGEGASPAAAPSPVASAPENPVPDKPKSGDRLDDLLQTALGGSKPKAVPKDDEPAPRKAAPEPASLKTIERSDMVQAMMAIRPKIKSCYSQYKVPGTAIVKVHVARGGKVTGADVSGKFAGTPTGNCVENAVKTARFPPVEAASIDYPFPLN